MSNAHETLLLPEAANAASPASAVCDCANPIEQAVGQWWVVHTKSRSEKALATDLQARGISHFLPLVSTIRKHGGRKVRVSLPLFPGYLFLCGQEQERYLTLMTHKAAGVIKVVDQARFKHELLQIYRVTASDAPVDLYPRLKQGQRCRIIRGGLRGLEGVVVRRRDVCRVYLGVEVLGQSAEVEIDPSLVEVID